MSGLQELLTDYRSKAGRLDLIKAARLGEELLDRTRDYEQLKSLAVPFAFAQGGGAVPGPFRRRALAAAGRLAASQPAGPWGPFFRRLLHKAFSTPYPEEEADVRRLRGLPRRRYAWLGCETGQYLLCREDFTGAAACFGAAAGYARPVDWLSRCRQAEALVCAGRAGRGLLLLERLRARSGAEEAAQAGLWQAKFLLWLGRSKAAWRLLDSASLRAYPGASGRRGAALVLLGLPARALPELGRACALQPRDLEWRLWKTEALHRLGRSHEAAAAAGEAASLNAEQNLYVDAVSGLVRASLGDWKGLRRHYDFVRSRAGVLETLFTRKGRLERYDDASILASLATVLRLSRGLRQGSHELRLWLTP